MASRRSPAAYHCRKLQFSLGAAPCPEGTRIYQKPTASSDGAQLWDRHPLTLSWFREAGPTIILNIIRDASVPLRGTIGVGYHIVPTAALLRSLQWVS